ncbi:hypothetical protein DTO212C5_1234 [Paecilomyces variotii]|nr:hypothetical protein DTO212C5_1234 [Paecilomyces variotii]
MQYYIPTDVAPPVQGMMPYPTQPFPRFFVIRPDHTAVPLVALDELPSWLQVGNWNWSDPMLFQSMGPASLVPVPRIGEYDVVCYHCCSNLDIIQRSVSEESDKSSPHTDDRKSCLTYPGALPSPARHRYQVRPTSALSLPHSTAGGLPYRSCNSNPKLCIVDTAEALNPEATVFDPTYATRPEVPRHDDPLLIVKSLPTTVSSSPTTAFSFESVSTRSHGQSSLSTSSMDAAVARLREIIGIGEKDVISFPNSGTTSPGSAPVKASNTLSTNPMHVSGNGNLRPRSSTEDTNRISEEKSASGERPSLVHGKSNGSWKGNNGTARGRRGRKRSPKKERTHGETGTEIDNSQGSQQSSPVKNHAKKANAAQNKTNSAYGSRYWHMMTMPNWRDKTPQR